ncbi:MAG TPA: ribonuclease HII [Candidatus Omnitrophota bacterium]|nr:ribonuclease HII [Candidatus Omnitrophota bacterium]
MISVNPRHLDFEAVLHREGFRLVAGVDEVGRGPLAGPVVACACLIPQFVRLQGIRDSKLIAPRIRRKLCREITCRALIGIGVVDVPEIDRLNILRASLLAMRKAVLALPVTPDFILIDGLFKIDLPIAQMPVVRGDEQLVSVGAASIVAKVTRDEMMAVYDQEYPAYGFARHKGYPTEAHLAALEEYGPSSIHRISFRPVSRLTLER